MDHVDCLSDVQVDEESQQLDCFGIYPQVLPIAYKWLLDDSKSAPQYKRHGDPQSQDELIYLGWAKHLYVLHTH